MFTIARIVARQIKKIIGKKEKIEKYTPDFAKELEKERARPETVDAVRQDLIRKGILKG